jgi:hypothetical protein
MSKVMTLTKCPVARPSLEVTDGNKQWYDATYNHTSCIANLYAQQADGANAALSKFWFILDGFSYYGSFDYYLTPAGLARYVKKAIEQHTLVVV